MRQSVLLAVLCVISSHVSSSAYGADVRLVDLDADYGAWVSERKQTSGLSRRRDLEAARALTVVVETSIAIGILFLLVRCLTHISQAWRSPSSGARRLAEENPCEGEVRSHGRLFYGRNYSSNFAEGSSSAHVCVVVNGTSSNTA